MKTGRPPAFSIEHLESVKTWYASGDSLDTIGKKLGCSSSAVNRFMVRHGLIKQGDDRRRLAINQNFFSSITTPEQAYWLGVLLTDGNVSGTRVCINLIDREHLQKFASALGCPNAPIGTHYKTIKDKTYIIYRLQFRNKTMVNDLAKLGITPQKSMTVRPWTGKPDLMPHFWRGCIDGDGSIMEHKPGRFSLMLCGNLFVVQAFLDYIKFTLPGVGMIPALCKNKNIYTVTFASIEDARAVCRHLYGYGGVSLNRKQQKANKAIVAAPWIPFAKRKMGRPRKVLSKSDVRHVELDHVMAQDPRARLPTNAPCSEPGQS